MMRCDDLCCIFQQSIDQIQQNWLKLGSKTIHCENDRHILFGIKRNCLGSGRSRSLFSFIRRVDKTDCSNYRGISVLSATHKILSNFLLSRLTAYAEEIIGDHQCWFWCNRSNTDHIYCICQILEKIWEYNEAVHQLFIIIKTTTTTIIITTTTTTIIESIIPF